MHDTHEGIVFFVTSDFSGLVRGRGVPARNLPAFLETGCGWVPADQAINAFDVIGEGNPFGASGDLRLMPDPATEVRIVEDAGRPPWHFFLADIQTLDGAPWSCCARSFLKAALADLEQRFGLGLTVSFEHEFTLLGDPAPAPGFSMRAFRRRETVVTAIATALRAAGAPPEMVLPEFGAGQFEIPLPPAPALIAADRAVVFREVVRDVAERQGTRATFAPKVRPEAVGNGVHIHLSLTDGKGRPVTYDAEGPGELSAPAAAFAAGVLRHIDALVALTAPSVVSYLRLKPHHWATAFACLGRQNREATIRICPSTRAGGDPAAGHHLEYRAADATASPYLALGALVRAGLAGLEENLPAPPLVDTDPADLDAAEGERLGVRPLPANLAAALDALEADKVAMGWAAPDFWSCYLAMKRSEWAGLADYDHVALCDAYSRVY